MNAQELADIRHALERVFSGDQSIEAGCVADALTDLGWCGLREPSPPPERLGGMSTPRLRG